MDIQIEGQEPHTVSSEEEISEALGKLDGEKVGFAILSRGEKAFMQTSGSPEKGFLLEYREPDSDIFQALDMNLPLAEIERAFAEYFRGESGYQERLTWEDKTLRGEAKDVDEKHGGMGCMPLLALAGVAGLLLATVMGG